MAPIKKVRKTAAVDLGAMLDAGDGTVVTLVAGDTRLAAHRAVLAARSPVFEAMFRHDTVEASSGEVAIPDVEGPVLRQLLAYMYTLQTPQEPISFALLLSAADKYGLSGLKAEYEQRLATELTVESAAAAAVLAVRHTCPTLRQAAVAFIKAHFVHVMGTVGWADAMRNQPEDLIEVSRLVAEPPAEIKNLPVVEKGRRLIEAAKEGTMELRTLLAAGADVNTRDEDEWTALHWAANSGHVDAARCLVDSGADVDAMAFVLGTPLHVAARSGHTAVVQLLVESSADCNTKNFRGSTPLHLAAINDQGNVVQLLVESSADYNAKDIMGRTPLHWAAESGHGDAAAALLDVGADKGAKDCIGKTPLMLATEHNQLQVIEFFNNEGMRISGLRTIHYFYENQEKLF